MEKERDESCDNIITRLRDEIIPVIERVISTGSGSFSNPGIANCRETLDCKAADCSLINEEGGPVRCWQHEDTPCTCKHEGGLAQRYEDCLECRAFRASCPTVVEELGEHLNNLSFLLNKQRQQNLKHRSLIERLRLDLAETVEKLHAREKEIQELMITDKLTTLFNRQHLITVLEDEIARCQRYGRPFSLLLIDIDEFRNFNDAYGHHAGDNILSFVGALIKENTRKFDRPFRYGGEEFVVVLPESDLTMAYIVAERIRKGFEHYTVPESSKETEANKSISCSVSIGITTTFAFGTEDISIDELINQTEQALNQAKDKGGNLCVRYD